MPSVLTPEQIAELQQFDSPTVNNALETFDAKYRTRVSRSPAWSRAPGSRSR
jgi:hypothetical protein